MKRGLLVLLVLQLVLSFPVFAASPSSWATSSINNLKQIGYYSEATYGNYQTNITRGEFIYLAVGMYEILSGNEIRIDTSIRFTDTDDVYARKGATVGITSGIGNGKFGADLLLTREQLATFLVRTLELLEVSIIDSPYEIFADDDKISDWAKDAVYVAKNNGFISGVGGNKMNPAGNATVETALTIIARILNESNGKDAITQIRENIIIDIYAPVAMQNAEPMNYQIMYEDTLEFTRDDIYNDALSLDSYDQEVQNRKNQQQYYEDYFEGVGFVLINKQQLSESLSEEDLDITIVDQRFDSNYTDSESASQIHPTRVITNFSFSSDFERISYYEKFVDGVQAGNYAENELEVVEVWSMQSNAFYILLKSYYTGEMGYLSLAMDEKGEIREGVFYFNSQGAWFNDTKSGVVLEETWTQ